MSSGSRDRRPVRRGWKVRPREAQHIALCPRQCFAIDKLAFDLEISVNLHDQHLAEIALEVERHSLGRLERRDRLHLDKVIPEFAVGALRVNPVRLDAIGDRAVKFAKVTIDLQMAPGEFMIIRSDFEQALENRHQIDVQVREARLELEPFKMRIDFGPCDPLAIVVDGVVVIPHICRAVHHDPDVRR